MKDAFFFALKQNYHTFALAKTQEDSVALPDSYREVEQVFWREGDWFFKI